MNQIEAVDKLIDVLEDGRIEQGEAFTNLSTRELVEAMAQLGLVFAQGSYADVVRQLDRMDANA